jgi:hypothetical protein
MDSSSSRSAVMELVLLLLLTHLQEAVPVTSLQGLVRSRQQRLSRRRRSSSSSRRHHRLLQLQQHQQGLPAKHPQLRCRAQKAVPCRQPVWVQVSL